MYNILLVDDDEKVLEINETYLTYRGFEVRRAKSIKQMISVLSVFKPNCIVLDVVLPDGNSVKTFDDIRKITNAPVVFLSGLAKEENIVSGFVAGGDDYVTKPFSPKVLEFRIMARIRNDFEKKKLDNVCDFDKLTIDVGARMATYEGKIIDLTAKEFNILLFLSRNEGNVYHSNDIYNAVWGMYDEGNPLTVQTHISNLRKKIKNSSGGKDYIKTVWGNGYKFVIPKEG